MNQPLRTDTQFRPPGVDLPAPTDELLVATGRVQSPAPLHPAKPRPIGDLSQELVCATQPGHPMAAAIYRIRTSLFLAHKDRPGPLMVAVVGAERGEGRTVLAANLAIAYAQVGARTVLIDGDMRHGRLHSLFNVGNEGGLARALTGRIAIDEGMPVLMDHDLVLIPAGAAADRQEMLSPTRFKTVVSRLALRADVIVVDTPAWSAGADAQLIAAETGMALLVSRIGQGSKAELRSLIDALAQAGTTTFAVPIH
ncbi:CpsD/CapB family tyrosine-protein kinase [Variovorax sp. LT1P1]|uniref:CpsD/CapB family tyrosine-protein kinase n=1 Tax=Variovorax sp. LT1P1 TaxID=3443730 RepID=UPI003F47C74B